MLIAEYEMFFAFGVVQLAKKNYREIMYTGFNCQELKSV